MRHKHYLLAFLTIGQFIGLLIMIERQAKAYVDPGSGLLTLQMMAASAAGGFFFLRHKLKKLMTRSAGKTPSAQERPSQSASSEPASVRLVGQSHT
jgi:hypothetical protein